MIFIIEGRQNAIPGSALAASWGRQSRAEGTQQNAHYDIDGPLQGCTISIANALELL